MILFHDKKGDVYATIDGRVHDKEDLNVVIESNDQKMAGKYIIGWVKNTYGKKASHMGNFKLLQKFEGNGPEKPLNYKVKNGKLIKK